MTDEQRSSVAAALAAAGLAPEQIRRALHAAALDVDGVVRRLSDCGCGDIRHGHMQADEILLECLSAPPVAAAFHALSKWYA